jgi:hypothetical protein
VTHTKRRCPSPTDAIPLLAGYDTITYSSRARISADVRTTLAKEKEVAQIAAKMGAVHCPDWLGARVLPNGGTEPAANGAQNSVYINVGS